MSNTRPEQWPDDGPEAWPVSILTAEDAKYWQNPPVAVRPVAVLSARIGTTAQERRKKRVQRRVRAVLSALAYCGVTVAAMVGGWLFIVVMVYGFSGFTG